MAASKRSRAYSRRRRRAAAVLDQHQGEVELGGAGVHVQQLGLDAGQGGRRRGLLEDEHGLEERVAPQVAVRRQLLHQLLEGQVLVGVGVQGGGAHPAAELPEGRDRPTRSSRSASVLVKKPISPSISSRLRLAIGEPTTTSSWPP